MMLHQGHYEVTSIASDTTAGTATNTASIDNAVNSAPVAGAVSTTGINSRDQCMEFHRDSEQFCISDIIQTGASSHNTYKSSHSTNTGSIICKVNKTSRKQKVEHQHRRKKQVTNSLTYVHIMYLIAILHFSCFPLVCATKIIKSQKHQRTKQFLLSSLRSNSFLYSKAHIFLMLVCVC